MSSRAAVFLILSITCIIAAPGKDAPKIQTFSLNGDTHSVFLPLYVSFGENLTFTCDIDPGPSSIRASIIDGDRRTLTTTNQSGRLVFRIENSTCDAVGAYICQVLDLSSGKLEESPLYVMNDQCPMRFCPDQPLSLTLYAPIGGNATIPICAITDSRVFFSYQLYINGEYIYVVSRHPKYLFAFRRKESSTIHFEGNITTLIRSEEDYGDYFMQALHRGNSILTLNITVNRLARLLNFIRSLKPPSESNDNVIAPQFDISGYNVIEAYDLPDDGEPMTSHDTEGYCTYNEQTIETPTNQTRPNTSPSNFNTQTQVYNEPETENNNDYDTAVKRIYAREYEQENTQSVLDSTESKGNTVDVSDYDTMVKRIDSSEYEQMSTQNQLKHSEIEDNCIAGIDSDENDYDTVVKRLELSEYEETEKADPPPTPHLPLNKRIQKDKDPSK